MIMIPIVAYTLYVHTMPHLVPHLALQHYLPSHEGDYYLTHFVSISNFLTCYAPHAFMEEQLQGIFAQAARNKK